MIIGGAFLGYSIDNRLFPNLSQQNIFISFSILLGIIILFVMIRISRNTGRTLAKYGREGKIKRMETNRLVKEGIYSYMRHPMHLGLFLFPLGIAFFIASPSFILIIAPFEILFMLIMIKLFEEPEAIAKFGQEYIDYKKELPWFCFKRKCLQELLKKIPKTQRS